MTRQTNKKVEIKESDITFESPVIDKDAIYDDFQAIFKDDVFGGSFASKVAYGQVAINAYATYPTGNVTFSGIWVKDDFSPTLVNIALKNAIDLMTFYRLHLYLSAKVLNTSQPDAVTAQLLCAMITALESHGVKRFEFLTVISSDKRELKYFSGELDACIELASKHTIAKREYNIKRSKAHGNKEKSKRSNKAMPVY